MSAKSKGGMEALGFELAADAASNHVVVSIEGLEKQGKTNIAFTADGPIGAFVSDPNTRDVVAKFRRDGKEIYVTDVMPPDKEQAKCKQQWTRIKEVYHKLLGMPDDKIRTVVFDTETELWELVRIAHFGAAQAMPYMYGPVNADYRRFLRAALGSTKDVIFVRKMKPKYINDQRTNDYEGAGFGTMKYEVQANIQVYRDLPDPKSGVAPEFHAYIKDSTHNPDLCGVTMSGPMCDISVIKGMILGGG